MSASRTVTVKSAVHAPAAAMGFPRHLLSKILCGCRASALVCRHGGLDSHVVNAEAACAGCGRSYEIRDGILRLLPGQLPLGEAAATEQGSRDAGAEGYDGQFPLEESGQEAALVSEALQGRRFETIVDLACGTGRITTELLCHSRSALAVDFSESSLRLLAQKLPRGANVGLIWSDATQLRLAPGSIHCAVATQLLEHVPDASRRRALFEAVHSALSPGGHLVLTAYYYSRLRRCLMRPQEGRHSSDIYYRRFTEGELEREMEGLFAMERFQPFQVDRRAARFLRRVPLLGARFENSLVADWVGHLFLLSAKRLSASEDDSACVR